MFYHICHIICDHIVNTLKLPQHRSMLTRTVHVRKTPVELTYDHKAGVTGSPHVRWLIRTTPENSGGGGGGGEIPLIYKSHYVVLSKSEQKLWELIELWSYSSLIVMTSFVGLKIWYTSSPSKAMITENLNSKTKQLKYMSSGHRHDGSPLKYRNWANCKKLCALALENEVNFSNSSLRYVWIYRLGYDQEDYRK